MDKSKFLSKAIGLYLIIISTAMLVHMKQIVQLMYGYNNSPALLFTTGLITVIVGLLIVLSHNIWQWNWKVVITITGWLILLKGVSLIIIPQYMNVLTLLFIHNTYIQYIGCGFDFLLGVFLSYMGFK